MRNVFRLGLAVFMALQISACSLPNTRSPSSREPAQAIDSSKLSSMSVAQLQEQLLTYAQFKKQNLPDSGSFRQLNLRHFVDASQRILKTNANPTEKSAKVLSLYQSMNRILNEQTVVSLLGREDKDHETITKYMNEVATKLETKLMLSPMEKFSQRVATDISFLRFLNNRVISQMVDFGNSLSNATERNQFITVVKNFKKLKGQVDILSTAVTTVGSLKTRVNTISAAPEWISLKKLYIPLQGSSEIDGLGSDFENAETIRLGIDGIVQILASLKTDLSTVAVNSKFDRTDLFNEVARYPAQESDDEEVVTPIAKMPPMTYANVTLVGNVPGQYVGKDKNSYALAAVEIKNRVIVNIKPLTSVEATNYKAPAGQTIVLKNNRNPKIAGVDSSFDTIYPGLIDLHDHTKQNNLPVWTEAKGQFENRFEWRAWGNYTKAVSQNMNPWIGFGKPVECAAFRWSELQSMVVGTTYLQGPSNCVENFAIQRVEDGGAYISVKDSVQAPTDVIYPNEMQFVWNTIRPVMLAEKKTYEQALSQVVNKHCPGIVGITPATVNEKSGLTVLKDQALLKKTCPEPLPDKFVRYVYWIHPTIAGRKNYFKGPNYSAVIAHLGEGRRKDPYNMREIELIRLLELDKPHMNFVHGVGISNEAELKNLAAKEIGLVWSPFSNLMLYSETLDILAAHKAGVRMSLGSDWLPTGSKGPLEEAKLAVQYVDKDPALKTVFNDEYIYKMMTENPARMINHWENKSVGGKIVEAGIGQIAVGSMGSVIVTDTLHANPFTNIVRNTNEEHINLMVIDGNVVYGDEDYVKQAGISNYEVISREPVGTEKIVSKSTTPRPPEDDTKAAKMAYLVQVGAAAAKMSPPTQGTCQFAREKVFVTPKTVSFVPVLNDFQKGTGLSLDKFYDIQRLISLNALSQSKNALGKDGDPNYALTYFPPLYSCNDSYHSGRIGGFVKANGSDEWTTNTSSRNGVRTQQKLGKGPKGLAEKYP